MQKHATRSRFLSKALLSLIIFASTILGLATAYPANAAVSAGTHPCDTGINNLNAPDNKKGTIKFDPDVNCRCNVDQCRLSKGTVYGFGTAIVRTGEGVANGWNSGTTLRDSLGQAAQQGANGAQQGFNNPSSTTDKEISDWINQGLGNVLGGEYECFDISDKPLTNSDAGYTKFQSAYYLEKLGYDKYYTQRFCEASGLNCTGGSIPDSVKQSLPPYATDEFSLNSIQKFVPVGSVCRGIKGKVAYWYYPGYFNAISQNYQGTASPGGTCENPILVSRDLFGKPVNGTETFFGCLPNSINGLVAFVLRIGVAIATLVTVLVILINLIGIIASSANPESVTEKRKKMVTALSALIGLYLSLTIISILGLQILDLGNLGGGVLRLFTGG